MTKKCVFTVRALTKSLRLDSFLSETDFFSSRSSVQNLIKKNQVLVNGETKKASFNVNNDDKITVFLSDDLSLIIESENVPLDIIYEDNDILVVNKPKKMLTHPTSKETKGTLVNALLYKYGYDGLSDINGIMRPGIVHRLDRNTSGLLMIAKNNTAHEFLAAQIKQKTAKRQYLAVVHGNFENKEGIINLPVGRNPAKPEKMAVIDGAKPSVTHYKILESFNGYSFIELTLETGRTHQIRVHMSHINHPVVNDTLYSKIPFKVKTTGQVLQAYKLQFAALKNDDIIKLEIPPDKDIQKVLKFLRSSLK